jgi:hypothetical protein
MAQICIQIPPLEIARTIGLEVTINGKKRLMQYRVESFEWGAGDAGARIDRLRALIQEYDPAWELVQIGNPTETLIPVMFRQRPGLPGPGKRGEGAEDCGDMPVE